MNPLPTDETAYHTLIETVGRARTFGYKQELNGAKLFGHVPHIAPLAWFHILYPALSEDELRQLEKEIQRPIPDAYAWWLWRTNGVTLFSGTLDFYGLVRVRSRRPENRQPFELWIEGEVQRRILKLSPAMFVFGGSGKGSGWRVYLDSTKGTVHRCNRSNPTPVQSWSSIADLLITELPRIESMFDDHGRRKSEAELWEG